MRARELLITEAHQLNEIDMSPRGLQQLASQIDARAGMEFEMIVPNVQSDIEPEYEPDYDQDQRSRSFGDVRDFFYDGDYNSRRDADRLIEELDGEYQEWKYEQTAEAWSNDGADFIRDYVSVNDLFDRDEAMAEARDDVIDANPDLPQESEEFSRLLSARLDEMEQDFAAQAFEDQGRIYNDAFEAFTDEQDEEYDEGSFLDDKYPYMTDIQNNFDIAWPYYYDINDGENGELDIDQVADDFSNSIGKPVNASRSYHGARREAGKYVVEPDGSLEGDNPGDAGLEFVSPPMPVTELLSDLQKVKAWADREGCYTNDSTGLHINVSVPGLRGMGENLDYVKLALLLGDERVLNEFGRSGNTYAKSAVEIVRKRVADQPEDAAALLNQMKGHLGDMASKAIHSGATHKYTSINTKDGYIEFRSPGGDWLGANFELIVPTLLRFVVALDAAIDPNKYRQEYLKKLYKLLTPKSEEDPLAYFAKFSAGELPKQALKSFVRQAQLQRKITKDPTGGQKYWWKVARPGYFASVEVVASSKEEAIAKGKQEYPDWRDARNMTATPLRPYQEPEAKPAQPGNWGIWIRSANRFARMPNTIVADNVLRRFPGRDSALQWIEQTRRENPQMRTDIEVREIEPSVQNTGSTTSGNWGVWVPSLDRYATIGNAGPRRFENQADAEAWIRDYNQRHASNDLELQAREIAPQQGRGAYTFRVFTTDSNQTVGTFQASGIQGSTNANIAFRNYLTSIGRDSAAGFNYEQIGRERQQPEFVDTTTQSSRGDLTPRGPGPWEIYRISDNSSVRELSNTSRPEAEQEARNALGLRGEAPELYGVRTRRAAQAGGEFRGTWRIMIDGEEVHRISGIGNNQADANRVGRNWVLQQISRGQLQPVAGAEVEVVPVMESR